MFSKLLVANRGEIAVRVIRTAREMGIATVAVYSEPDRNALHVELADEAYLLGPAVPSQSYLNGLKLIEIAQRSAAQAVHPGYGFLAENAAFARAVVAAGLTWIGPRADAIAAMGDKLGARQAMTGANVPVVPGGMQPIENANEARKAAKAFGLPLALKAAGGGGGKGLKIARSVDDVGPAFENARREAEAYFKNGTIYAERYLENPKHIELQLLADKHGNVIHVGERDCSLQRRHQKLWEETPVSVSPEVQAAMRDAGLRAARAIGYDSVGTVEYLVSGNEFYFLEMNTRIQVEHTVSEMISGLDLIREQIRVAAGEPLAYDQSAIDFRGCSIEVRVNAEDPAANFRPAPGTIVGYREPAGLGVRVDSAAFAGWTIPPEYDSLVAKLIVWDTTREGALARLRRAIDEYRIEGVPTTLPLLRALCDQPSIVDASYTTGTLEAVLQTLALPAQNGSAREVDADRASGEAIRVEINDRLYRVRLVDGLPAAGASPARKTAPRLSRSRTGGAKTSGNDVVSPMHGVIVELSVAEGDSVQAGQVVAVVEAMKMMNEVRAHKSGSVAAVHVGAGATVEPGSTLVTID